MDGLEKLNDLRNCLQAYMSMENVPSIDDDLDVIEKELKYAEAVNEHIFEFYYEGLKGYAGAKEIKEEMFYMGLLETLVALYHKINNVSKEEARRCLSDLAAKRIEESKAIQGRSHND